MVSSSPFASLICSWVRLSSVPSRLALLRLAPSTLITGLSTESGLTYTGTATEYVYDLDPTPPPLPTSGLGPPCLGWRCLDAQLATSHLAQSISVVRLRCAHSSSNRRFSRRVFFSVAPSEEVAKRLARAPATPPLSIPLSIKLGNDAAAL